MAEMTPSLAETLELYPSPLLFLLGGGLGNRIGSVTPDSLYSCNLVRHSSASPAMQSDLTMRSLTTDTASRLLPVDHAALTCSTSLAKPHSLMIRA